MKKGREATRSPAFFHAAHLVMPSGRAVPRGMKALTDDDVFYGNLTETDGENAIHHRIIRIG